MNDLPIIFYTWFPVQAASYYPLYFNLNKTFVYSRNRSFIDRFKKFNTEEPNPLFRYVKAASEKNLIPSLLSSSEIEEAFTQVHFTPLNRSEIFSPKECRLGLPASDEMWMPTERFFWSFPQANLGSSRHILLQGLQLKGSGRNPLATRVDHTHSWGGQHLWQNLKALTFTRLYSGCLPLGLLETVGISLEPNELHAETSLDPFTNSMLIREARSYRLTQVMTDFDPNSEPPKSFYQNKCEDLSFQEFYFQYASMLALGISDLNITRENLMINGALIDYEDISYSGDDSFQTIQVTVNSDRSHLSTNSSLDDLGEVTLFTSNVHMYLIALKLTFEAREKFLHLQAPSSSDIVDSFLKVLRQFNSEVYEIDSRFFELVEELVKLKGNYVDGVHQYHLKGDSANTVVALLKKFGASISGVTRITPNENAVDITLKIPRGRWKNQKLETYYQSIQKLSLSDMTKIALKLYVMLSPSDKKWSFKKCLEFSSRVDKVLARNAWILPYQFTPESFRLKTYTFAEVTNLITPGVKIKDFKINSFQVFNLDQKEFQELSHLDFEARLNQEEEFILQGYTCDFEHQQNHFVPISPVYVKGKNSN